MKRIFIIAEAGVNHNGNMVTAKKLIDAAAEAGADAVKFQTFTADSLVCRNAAKAEYQLITTGAQESQWEMLKKLELTADMHKELIEYCKIKQIKFLSTPFSCNDIDLLAHYNLDTYKIPSGEITNYPYLLKIGALRKRIILSTGMADLSEVEEAVKVLRVAGTTDITLLHCNTEYPTPKEDVNLSAMVTMWDRIGLPVGYSDHTEGIEAGMAAAALGAAVIEKHFTLDKNMAGPDHKASLEPEEFNRFIVGIRKVELMLGSGEKVPSGSEKKNRDIVRKSIVAKNPIRKGDLFSNENLTTKRPGTGISPMEWKNIVGTRALRNYDIDEQI